MFSLKDEDLYKTRDKRSRLYLGKLRALPPHTIANSTTAEYVLYDSGTVEATEHTMDEKFEGYDYDASSSNKYGTGDDDGESLYRKEMAIIVIHNPKRPVTPGVRPLEVAIPNTRSHVRRGNIYTLERPFKDAITNKKQNSPMHNKVCILHERVSRCCIIFCWDEIVDLQ